MQTKTLKLRGVESSAYCRNCDWSKHASSSDTRCKLGSAARYHAVSKGHEVEVYREKGIVIKPVT